jgi:type II secretory pathway component PulF
MSRFHYRALQPSGAEIAGELVADSEHDVAARLQAVGNYPIEIAVPAAGAASLRR